MNKTLLCALFGNNFVAVVVVVIDFCRISILASLTLHPSLQYIL